MTKEEILKKHGWYDLNVSAGNYRIPMPYVLEFMEEYANQFREDIKPPRLLYVISPIWLGCGRCECGSSLVRKYNCLFFRIGKAYCLDPECKRSNANRSHENNLNPQI
jgi:hypothetical protein